MNGGKVDFSAGARIPGTHFLLSSSRRLTYSLQGMGVVCRWILLCSLLAAAASRVTAAPNAEKSAFDAASEAFHDTFWARAESEFGTFAQTYTNSARLPAAILYQAEARLEQGNYAGALELLDRHQDKAGRLADLYLFWKGETLYRRRELRLAAETFARLIHEFPSSTNRLEAAVREASAWSELARWPQVVATLQDPAGPFLSAATSNKGDDLLYRGFLLLAQAQLAQTNCEAADAALASLAKFRLSPKLDWERQYLHCRVRVAAGQISEAYRASTNLAAMATATGAPELQADTAAFQGGLLERMGEWDQALAVYRKNLSGTVSAVRQRQALLKVTELYVHQNRLADAAQTLENFLTNYPNADSADLALVTLGELRLREYESGMCTNPVAVTTSNLPAASVCLTQALRALETFTTRFPKSQLLGRAEFSLGWCCWEDGRIAASQAAFQSAAERLPFSAQQAMAFFKLADAQYRQTNYVAAIANYQTVVSKYDNLPEVSTNLFEPALYHIVRAALDAGKPDLAKDALAKLLSTYPEGFFTDRAVLLTGQVTERRDPASARKMFQDFLSVAPKTPLAPELLLAIASTYAQQNQWDSAIHEYDACDAWLDSHTNRQAQARVEYARAWANYQAGREAVALTEFTNFVARFPTNPSAPLAQLWVGDYYYRIGDFFTAEQNYQTVYQNTNWPGSPLGYQAMMMAGRAAFARQGWKDAREFYFGRLASNTNCPAEIRAQAFFALGDTLVTQASTNKLEDYKEALTAYDQVGLLCPTNPVAMLALGAKANCLLQCQDYAAATNAFEQVIHSPLSEVTTRSSAKVGLGLTLEKIAQQLSGTNQAALIVAAREQYLDVLYSTALLRPGEKADPFWTMKAGLEAARICEQLKDTEREWKVYLRLHRDFPFLPLDEKLKTLQAQSPLVQQN